MSNEDHVLVGRHEHRFEPPDMAHVVFRGMFDRSELEAHFEFMRRSAERHKTLLCAICHLDGLDGLTGEARKYAINMDDHLPYRALALITGTVMIRIIAETSFQACQILAPDHFTFPVQFFATAPEAERWFAGLRRRVS